MCTFTAWHCIQAQHAIVIPPVCRSVRLSHSIVYRVEVDICKLIKLLSRPDTAIILVLFVTNVTMIFRRVYQRKCVH